MGSVQRNHAQIREARTEPAERQTIGMDQLEIVSTHSEPEQERQPADPEQMELESAPPQADECRLCCSQRMRKRPSRFKDYVILTHARDELNSIVLSY